MTAFDLCFQAFLGSSKVVCGSHTPGHDLKVGVGTRFGGGGGGMSKIQCVKAEYKLLQDAVVKI